MKDIRVDANIQMSFYTSALNVGIYLKFRRYVCVLLKSFSELKRLYVNLY